MRKVHYWAMAAAFALSVQSIGSQTFRSLGAQRIELFCVRLIISSNASLLS